MENEKYKIKVWKTEYDRKWGETFEHASGLTDLEAAIEEAKKEFNEHTHSCVEVVDEEDEDCLFHISTEKPEGKVLE